MNIALLQEGVNGMSTEVKLSQSTAIRVEHARINGMSDAAILEAIRTQNASGFDAVADDYYVYDEFLSYAAEHGERLEEAVKDGYRMTFNTRGGLGIWLEKAFGLKADQDFTVGEGIVTGLRLKPEQAEILARRLATNWIVAESVDVPAGKELTLKLRALA